MRENESMENFKDYHLGGIINLGGEIMRYGSLVGGVYSASQGNLRNVVLCGVGFVVGGFCRYVSETLREGSMIHQISREIKKS